MTSLAAVLIITNQAAGLEEYLRKSCLMKPGRKVAFSSNSSSNNFSNGGISMLGVTSSLLGGGSKSNSDGMTANGHEMHDNNKSYQSI